MRTSSRGSSSRARRARASGTSRSTTPASSSSTRSTSSRARAAIKVVATGLVSNSLGTINPVERLAAWAHEQGAIMVVDAAQAAPHRPIDVQALGCDFLAFSSHKLCGPSGVGALWGRRELLEAMEPFNLGGEMIRSVGLERTTFNELPVQVRGRHARDRRGRRLRRRDRLHHRDRAAGDRAARARADGRTRWTGSASSTGCALFGPPAERRAGIVSFEVAGIHPHDVAQILDWEGVAVRAGHHCTQPLMARLGVAATTRASFYLYSIAGRGRPARRRASTRSRRASDERVRAALPRGHPRPLQDARATTACSTRATPSPRARTRSAATR